MWAIQRASGDHAIDLHPFVQMKLTFTEALSGEKKQAIGIGASNFYESIGVGLWARLCVAMGEMMGIR